MPARKKRAARADDGLPGGLIFAPWRMQYVRGLTTRGARRCPFCPLVRSRADVRNRVLHRGTTALVVLNLFPYTPGHLLVVPKRHVGATGDLRTAERRELWDLALRGQAELEAEYRPAGFNIGMNLGRAGGAAVVDHVHLHVVPRFDGDSNFMPVVGGTRVCPEGLDETYARLRPHFSHARRR